MRTGAIGCGLEAIRLDGATVVLADASSARRGASEAELAEAAARSLGALLGRSVPVLYAFQVHSSLTFVYEAGEPLGSGAHFVGNCDGLITAEPWVALQVRNADCLPVALVGRGVAAMLHAGWRGLAADIPGRALARLQGEFGIMPGEMAAVIGVGVGPCHYPVGSDVIAGLKQWPVDDPGWEADGRVDLARFAAGRLRRLGIAPDAVRVLPGCTACDARWHSYRRDGERAGRQWCALVLTPEVGGAGSAAGP